MAQRIIILKRAENKVKKVYEYLLENWSEKVAEEFYTKFEKTIHRISLYPQIGHPSAKRPDIRKKLVTKHNCLYYRIRKDKIIVINMLDTRRDPRKNPYG